MKKIIKYVLIGMAILYGFGYILNIVALQIGLKPTPKNDSSLQLIEFGRRQSKDIYIHAQKFNGSKPHYQALRNHAAKFKGDASIKTVLYFDAPFRVPTDSIYGGIENQYKCIALYIVPIDNFIVNPNGATNQNGEAKFIEPTN